MITVLDPLLMPDQVRLSDTDRQAAAAKLDNAVRRGTLTPPQATDRRDQLQTSRTRGELRRVFDGIADAVPPVGLTIALRAMTGVWLVAFTVQFVVWLTLAMFGHFDGPWWLWSDVGLGLIVAALWWAHESYHRKTDVRADR
jgi:Domain of unknown function (DUF1707)